MVIGNVLFFKQVRVMHHTVPTYLIPEKQIYLPN